MMAGPPLLCLLLLLFGVRGQASSSACPAPCSCRDGQADCSRRSLTTSSLPTGFPPDTTHLRLHDNLLTSLPDGLLDALPALRSVSLHGNPWACDCGVLYLRGWLLRRPDGAHHLNVSCSYPPGLRGRLVVYLAEEEVLESCHYWYCDLALVSQVCLCVFVLVQAGLLVAVVIFLRRFEGLNREARWAAEESFTRGERPPRNQYQTLLDTSI